MDDDYDDLEWQAYWRVVPVSSLPFPFHLFKCPFEARHLRALELAGADPDAYASPQQCSKAFRLFKADLGPEIATCPYHQPDWKLAAERAVAAVRSDPNGSHAEPKTQDLDADTEWAAWEFFTEPIFINGTRLGNGQHRVCAMKCAGVRAAPIQDYRRPGGHEG